jgi:hypothetical protein
MWSKWVQVLISLGRLGKQELNHHTTQSLKEGKKVDTSSAWWRIATRKTEKSISTTTLREGNQKRKREIGS